MPRAPTAPSLGLFLLLGACGGDDAGSADCGATWTRTLDRGVEIESLRISADGALVLGGAIDARAVDFGDGPWTPDTVGGFLVVYEPDGTLRFRRALDGPASQRVREAADDGAGGFVVAGELVRTVEVGGMSADGVGGPDAFVARFDGTGAPLWLVSYGSDGDDSALTVDVTGDGGVAVAGRLGGSVDFGGTTVDRLGTPTESAPAWWVAELSLDDGSPRWAASLTGPRDGSVRAGPGGVTFAATTSTAATELSSGPVGPLQGRSAAIAVHFGRDGALAWSKLLQGTTPASMVSARALEGGSGGAVVAGSIEGAGGDIDGMELDASTGPVHFALGAAPDGAVRFLRINVVPFVAEADGGRIVLQGAVPNDLLLGDITVSGRPDGSVLALYDPESDTYGAIRAWGSSRGPSPVALGGSALAAWVDPGMLSDKTVAYAENAPDGADATIERRCGLALP